LEEMKGVRTKVPEKKTDWERYEKHKQEKRSCCMKRIYPLQGMRVWHSMLIIGLTLAVGALSIAYARKEHDYYLLSQKLAKGSHLKQQLMDYENELKAKSERIEDLEEKLHNQEEVTERFEELKEQLHREEEKLAGRVEELKKKDAELQKMDDVQRPYQELKKRHEELLQKYEDQQPSMSSRQNQYPSSDSLVDSSLTSSASLTSRRLEINNLATQLGNNFNINRSGSSQSLASFKLSGSIPNLLSLPGVLSRDLVPGDLRRHAGHEAVRLDVPLRDGRRPPDEWWPVRRRPNRSLSSASGNPKSSPKGRRHSSSTERTQDQ